MCLPKNVHQIELTETRFLLQVSSTMDASFSNIKSMLDHVNVAFFAATRNTISDIKRCYVMLCYVMLLIISFILIHTSDVGSDFVFYYHYRYLSQAYYAFIWLVG
jgi:hypothetical protein